MIFVTAIHIELTDVVNRDLVLLELYPVGIGCELVREVPDVVRECRGKQNNLYGLITRKHAV